MKWLLCYFLAVFAQASPPDMRPIREMYTRAVESKAVTRQLLDDLKKAPQTPVIAGYAGAATILQAKHAFNPLSKLRYFRSGRDLLEKAIANSPNEPELRFLRYAIQVKAPAILHYSSEKRRDRMFLERQLRENTIADPHLRAGIISFLGTHH